MPIQRLDESQPYGHVAGQPPAGLDRPPAYAQGGRYYDAHKRLITPGKPLDPAEGDAEEANARAEVDAEALAQEEARAWAHRREEAAVRAREKELAAQSRAKVGVSRIAPPYHPPELDRPAHYEWGGRYLDEHGREIVPGVPLSPEALAAAQEEEADAEGLTLAQLIAQADILPFNVLMAAAKAVLGPTCPHAKDQMVGQLRLLARRQPNLRVPRIRPAG
jgi:hypothetical protein